jgi:arsenate reductase
MIIYHNPRCSKSRQTLELLRERGIEPEIIEYLKTPPTREALETMILKLAIEPRALLRKSEASYKDLNLSNALLSDAALIDAMVQHPELIERPIVINGERAALGRPPENVLDIL